MKLCECELPKEVRVIPAPERWPLINGGYTTFYLQQCLGCGGICGFPQQNFEIALEKGSEITKSKLAEFTNG